MFCCWAWEVRAFARKYSANHSAGWQAFPNFTSWIQPIRRESNRLRTESIWEIRSSSFPASQAQRSNRISSNNIFHSHKELVGEDQVGSRFIAITDPGSKLRQEADHDRFRKVFLGVPTIGGRYSALSDFGLVPAAAMGLDVARFLDRTNAMVVACGPDKSSKNNPGVILGAILGTAQIHGRDKLTIIASPGIHDLGAWLEQLIAESTGKNGEGIIPVDREPLAPAESYGDDRVFVYLRLESAADTSQDAAVAELSAPTNPLSQSRSVMFMTWARNFSAGRWLRPSPAQ